MKKNNIFLKSLVVALCASLLALTSCEDMLKVDSGRYETVDNNNLSSPNDSVSSIFGLLKGMQRVGDRYILLGEMRADLLDVTEYTPAAIRQLSNFEADSTNEYTNPRDYYALINNCNYFISRTSGANSSLKGENALAHAIRAWTYMQIATIWGKAYYLTDPLLTVDDTKKDYSIVDVKQLSDLLITDLEPFEDVVYPNYGEIYNFSSSDLFLPIKLLLGDLYLWRGSSTEDYEKSATFYAEFIDNHYKRFFSPHPFITWSYESMLNEDFEMQSPIDFWSTNVIAGSNEMITTIQMAQNASEGIVSSIPGNMQYYASSKSMNDLWDKQKFVFHYSKTFPAVDKLTNGDLRKYANVITEPMAVNGKLVNITYLYKLMNDDHIQLYRMGLIYLRYAEAVNRAGNPDAAFAVLKYGLKPKLPITPSEPPSFDLTIIPAVQAEKPYINIFNKEKYRASYEFTVDIIKDYVTGIHARGCGDSAYDTSYKIGGIVGNLTSKSDSIEWVENAICDELALETSFEGNRFGDLVRIAQRRNDLDYLAKRIASKHVGSEYNRIYSLLSSDKNNWFLPTK